jgi:hypothetical protein
MYRLLVACLLLSVLSPLLRADDIAVYRGTIRVTTDAQTSAGFAKTVKTYLVVNYTTRESNQIIYFTKVTKRMSSGAAGYRIGQAALPNSKNISLFATGNTANTAADEFEFRCTMLRGNNVNLVIETNPARRSIARPRSLTGDSLVATAEPGQATVFQDLTVTYTLDNAKTFAANNEDKTLTVATDEIKTALAAQGYVEL